MARGDRAAELKRINRLMDLARDLDTAFVATCDWGHRLSENLPAVAYRKSGGQWLAVCEDHAKGAKEGQVRR